MKVLVIGSGGREHAIAYKLNQSNKVDQIRELLRSVNVLVVVLKIMK